ncbi:rab guanine nucleotide exchange factor S2 [Chytriomyces hyalinus]|nr:rab guanine nucleotide exchange factor S2 [Chytriomyces hyalinus]
MVLNKADDKLEQRMSNLNTATAAPLSTRLEQVALKHAIAPGREDRLKLSALAETLSAQLHTPMKLEAANECIHNTLVSPQSFACAKCAAEFPPSITIRAQAKAVDDALRRAKRCVAEYADKQLTSAQDLTHLSTRIQTLSAKSHAQTQASNALKAACVLETAKVLDLVEKRLAVLGERDALVEEIEDRTQELFEKANGLVADEAKRRYVSQTRVRTLESELEDLEGQLAMEKMQSSELRAKMEELRQLKEANEAEKAAETATDAIETEQHVLENAPSDPKSDDHAIKSVLDAVSASLSESPQRESPEVTAAEESPVDADGPTPVPTARLRSASASAILLTASPAPAIEPDAQLLQDLQSFIKECGVTKLTKLHTLPFLKTCLEEDVLPCLKFGGNPRTATRKLVDAILVNSCFLEEMNASQIEAVQSYHNSLKEALDAQTAHNANPNKSNSPSKNSPTMSLQQANTILHAAVASMNQTATHQLFQRTVLQALWTTASSSSSATTPLPASIVLYGCPACGCAPAVTRHHFKISDSNTDKWIPICIHCRGRLLAVCEFYNFVRHLKLGLYSTRAEADIYAEVIGLRGRMWEARCGGGFSVPSSALASGSGVSGGIGGMASKGKNSLRPDSVLFDGLDVGV